MEPTGNPAPESNNPNGFVNRVFSVSLDVENETSAVSIQETSLEPAEGQGETQVASFQTPVKDRQEVNRRPRATGGIWKILNRKRAASELERRPHSMILPGEASIPKLSFADKVRSFKKLKSPSVFRGKAGKLSTAKLSSSLVDEDSFCRDFGTPQQSSRGTLRHRGKRHSYAGCTADFDCSFEDIDLAVSIEGQQQQQQPAVVAAEAVTQNGCKPVERVSYAKKSLNNSANCNKTACEEPGVKASGGAHQARAGGGRRHKDVWSYLRRISLLGKANPVYSERSFDSELHSLDKTMDSDYGSVDLESVRDFQPPPPPKGADSKGHFGGLFKFFNSVAETARKWRTTSHSFSPPEGERNHVSSPRTPQGTVDNVHSLSLTLHADGPSESLPTPSASPVAVKSLQSLSYDSEASASVTGGGTPKVVLRAFKASSGRQALNGLQGLEGTETNHRSAAVNVNHSTLSDSNCVTVESRGAESDKVSRLRPEEKSEGQTGNEKDSRDAPPNSREVPEKNIQSLQGDKESTANRIAASNSTEEIFKVCGVFFFKCKWSCRSSFLHALV